MSDRLFSAAWMISLSMRLLVVALIVFGFGRPAMAGDAPPVVGPGATREAVIDAYGWPTGQSQLGPKEILTYPQGRITLENGRVERVDFSTSVPWPAPRPRPGPAAPTSVKPVEAPVDFWVTDFEQAQLEARRRRARILALFIGSDWSPPSRQFQDEVAFHPEFVNAFTGDFVFLRLDFPTRAAQSAALKEQNARLRAAYGVTTYPALLILSPAGTAVATVDLTKSQVGDTYRARVIAAIREMRDLLAAVPPPPDPEPVAAVAAPAQPAAPEPNAGSTSVSTAKPLVLGAMGVGLLLAVAGWWFLWGKRARVEPDRTTAMAERISDAAGGVPSGNEVAEWSLEKLRAVTAGLAESEGFEVTYRAGGGDGDLSLTRKGEEKPAVIVGCLPAEAGAASAKRLKELYGTITIEDVAKGWYVAPRGFAKDARDYAAAHPALVLIDTDYLIAQMRAAPPVMLPKILARKA